MTEPGEDEGKVGKFRINFSPDGLRRYLHAESKSDSGLYSQVSRHSRDYQDALGFSEQDIEQMERRQGRLGMYPSGEDWLQGSLLKVEIEGKGFGIFAKNTACHDYGEPAGWRYLLMAVSNDQSLNKEAGGGTSLITSIPDEWHTRVIDAINQSGKNDDLSGDLFKFLKK